MSGDEGEKSLIDFNECVSQGQLQGVITKAMEGVNEHITKSVTDAIVKLNLGNIGHTLERFDKRLSTLTRKVEGMETRLPSVKNNNNDTNNDEDPIINGANGNVDERATMEQDFVDAYTTIIKVWEVITTTMVVVPMMTLLLRLNFPYLPFLAFMMLRLILIGR
jgi:hypothetical protein